ncbi:MAG: pyocin knob domain-containing protein [Candidatus Gracilibacteria bacterium]|nr:pyocin knob domain-containing protein [Candidatus Gracilibacteria bacterium]
MAISRGGVLALSSKSEAASWSEALPSASAANISAAIHTSTDKTSPVNLDELVIADSESSFSLKKLTLNNLKTFLFSSPTFTGTTTANALNVTTLNGQSLSQFIIGGVTKKSLPSSNMNDLTQKSGFYYGNAMTGAPDADWWMYINAYGDSWADANTYGYQLAQKFWSDALYIRRVNNGVYQPWRQIGGGVISTSGPSGGIDGDIWYQYS